MLEGSLPAVLLKEPYTVPSEYGMPPRGRESGSRPNGTAAGVRWQPDWRGEAVAVDDYQGYGGPEAAFVSLGSATGWDAHTGRIDSNPYIHGYTGSRLQETTLAELRAGSTIFWPTSGQSEPGFDPVLLELPFEPGFDVGWQQWLQQGRRMLFEPPPDYSQQTEAIPAIGWP